MTAFVSDNTAAQAWAGNHWGRGGVAPQFPGDAGSTPADTVAIPGATPPTNGPAAASTVAAYSCNNNGFQATANLTIAAGGSLALGITQAAGSPGQATAWYGDASQAATCTFVGNTDLYGKAPKNAVFGVPGATPPADTDYYIWPGATVGNSATFYGGNTSQNSGTVGNYATLVGNTYYGADNEGVLGNFAMFAGGINLTGTVGKWATVSEVTVTLTGTYGAFLCVTASGVDLSGATLAGPVVLCTPTASVTVPAGVTVIPYAQACTFMFATVTVMDSTQNGQRMTGLTPAIVYAGGRAGSNLAASIDVTEMGNGDYQVCCVNPAVPFGDVTVQLDFGATLVDPGDRYRTVTLLWSQTAAAMQQAPATALTAAAATNTIATPTNVPQVAAMQTGLAKTTDLAAIPAAVWSYLATAADTLGITSMGGWLRTALGSLTGLLQYVAGSSGPQQFSAQALAAGGQATANVVINPVAISLWPGQAGTLRDLYAYQHANLNYVLSVSDKTTGNPYNFTGKGLALVLYRAADGGAEFSILSGGPSTNTLAGTSAGQVTVTGDSSNTRCAGKFTWDLWNTTDNVVVGSGQLFIRQNPPSS